MKRMTVGLALLLLAGCGQAVQPYRPKEAPAAAASEPAGESTGEPANAAESTPTAGPLPDTIDVGGELEVRVRWPERDDALVRLFPDYYAQAWEAVMSGDDRYLRHVEPAYAGEAAAWVRNFTGKKQSVSGVVRLFRLRVKAVVGRGAELNVCVDETKMKVISASTGEAITPQPASSRAPYLQIVLAHRDDDGVWRIRNFSHSKEGCS